MYSKPTLALAGLLGLLGLALSGLAGAADTHTRLLASTCMSCHGPGGKSQGNIPSLVALDKDHFVKLMQGFKAGTRSATIMKRHASGYTDDEIAAMGAYFATLK